MYITPNQVNAAAEYILSSLEVSPLSHSRKMEIAREYCIDEFGFSPRTSLVLHIVGLANLGWEGIKIRTLKQLGK